MARKRGRGNGEGSLYEHKRDGRKVGYRGAYTVHTASSPESFGDVTYHPFPSLRPIEDLPRICC
jgi:hypothetical protein